MKKLFFKSLNDKNYMLYQLKKNVANNPQCLGRLS